MNSRYTVSIMDCQSHFPNNMQAHVLTYASSLKHQSTSCVIETFMNECRIFLSSPFSQYQNSSDVTSSLNGDSENRILIQNSSKFVVQLPTFFGLHRCSRTTKYETFDCVHRVHLDEAYLKLFGWTFFVLQKKTTVFTVAQHCLIRVGELLTGHIDHRFMWQHMADLVLVNVCLSMYLGIISAVLNQHFLLIEQCMPNLIVFPQILSR